MNDLIKALQILANYANPNDYSPTHCEHDVFRVYAGIEPTEVSEEDIKELKELGFFVDDEFGCFKSFKFGSC